MAGPVVWAVALVASFAGWGAALARAAGTHATRAPAALRASWGVAVVVFVGGCMQLAGVASARGLLVLVATGLVLTALDVARRVRGFPLRRLAVLRRGRAAGSALVAARGALAVAALARLFASTRFESLGERWDDRPAYLAMIEQLAQTGSFPQPFCLRRLQALGGQTLLQALLFADGADAATYVHLLDWGVCTLLVVWMLGSRRVRSRREAWLGTLAAAFALLLFVPIWNAAAEFSGVTLVLALALTLERMPRAASTWRELLPLAVVAGAACALRNNFVPVVSMLLVLGASSLRERLRAGALGLAFLAPWMIESWREFRTPLFPLLRGTYVAAAGGLESGAPVGLLEHARHFARNAAHGGFSPLTLVVLLVLAVAAPPSGRRPVLRALAACTVLGLAAQTVVLPLIDPLGQARYFFPYAAATVLLAVAAAGAWGRRMRWVVAAVAVACVAQVVFGWDDLTRFYGAGPRTLGREALAPPYRAMQQAVPERARVLTFLDDGWLLDFGRNPVLLADSPGAVSPSPGMPVLGGTDAVVTYLLAQDIRYVAFVRPDASHGLYNREDWLRQATSDAPNLRPHRNMAAYWLATVDLLDALPRLHRVLYDGGGLVVVDLGADPAAQ